MSKFFKATLLLAVVGAIVWVASLWRWHRQNIDPDGRELLIYLVVIPIVLTGALLLLVWQAKKIKSALAQPVVPILSTQAQARQTDEKRALQAVAAPPAPFMPLGDMTIIASHLRAITSSDWDQALADSQAGQRSPKAHATLRNRAGLPTRTADIDDLDLGPVRVALNATLALPDELVRTLALLADCIDFMSTKIRTHWSVLGTGAEVDSSDAELPRLLLVVAMSDRWPEEIREPTIRWVKHYLHPLVTEGLRAAGQGRTTARNESAVKLYLHWIKSPEEAWVHISQLTKSISESNKPTLLGLFCSDSLIGKDSILKLDDSGQLFGAQCPQGVIPGEGAAALLLASSGWLSHPACPLTPMACAQGSPLVPNKTTRANQLQAVLKEQPLSAAEVGHVTSDVPLGEQIEVMSTVHEQLPALDAATGLLCFGTACGDVGLASPLLSLALASGKTQIDHTPGVVVCRSLQSVLLLRPVPSS